MKRKVAVVTGGANGIGLGIARELGKAGCRLSLADIASDGLDRALDDLSAEGIEVTTTVTDVGRLEDMERLAERTVAEFGAVDIVVNNAGVIAWNPVDALTIGQWRWAVDVNMWGVIHGVHVFLPILERQGSEGHFVNVSSVGGVLADAPFMATYSATKAAIIGLSLTLASELQLQGQPIAVTIVCPSGTREGRAHFAENNRQDTFGSVERTPGAQAVLDVIAEHVAQGQPVETLARRVVAGIRAGELWVFPHPEAAPLLQPRLNSLSDVLGMAGSQTLAD